MLLLLQFLPPLLLLPLLFLQRQNSLAVTMGDNTVMVLLLLS